jgi:DNA replication protein DnaC
VPCELCDGTTWKTITVDGVARVARCECWHQQLYETLLKNARIPRRYLHCELTNFETHTDSQRTAHRRALKLVDEFPVAERGLLLFGEAGVGKTHLAVAVLKEIVRRKGGRAIFYETRELLKLVRDTYSTRAEASELDVLQPVLEAELLVLDDLGAEKKSEWVEETLGLVVNTRYSERRLTVFTTNLSDVENTEPTSFAFQLGLRTRSRLLEMCEWVRMEGVDTREVGPHPTHDDIIRWQQSSPGSPKNRTRGALPPKAAGQVKAQLKPREPAERDGRADLRWPGGRAGS